MYATIITFKPCASNAEFQHFILRFNKISLLLRKPNWFETEKGVWGGVKGGPKTGWRQGDFTEGRVFFGQFFEKETQSFFENLFSKDPVSPCYFVQNFFLKTRYCWCFDFEIVQEPATQGYNKIKGPPNTGLNFKAPQILKFEHWGFVSEFVILLSALGELASTLVPWKKAPKSI
jgi:hypothetical protein